jgi:hypothetical protein
MLGRRRTIRSTTSAWVRRARCAVASRLYRDVRPGTEATIVVAGVARSGTTWVGEILSVGLGYRIVFEPFHADKVSGFKGFNYLQYMRPGDEDSRLAAFSESVFSGAVRDPRWIDKQVEFLRPRGRIVKDVRICLMLRWVREKFPRVPIVFVLRHPCAVASSHSRLGWSSERDLASMLEQPKLVEDVLGPHMDTIRGAARPHEKHAVLWCVNNLVVLRHFADGGLHVCYYEDLVEEPKAAVSELFEAVGRDYDPAVLASALRPSLTTSRGSAQLSGAQVANAWQSELTGEEAADVMEIVRSFGMDHLYRATGEPSHAL